MVERAIVALLVSYQVFCSSNDERIKLDIIKNLYFSSFFSLTIVSGMLNLE